MATKSVLMSTAVGSLLTLGALSVSTDAQAQLRFSHDPVQLTLEAYGNTAAAATSGLGAEGGSWQADGALRGLALIGKPAELRFGVRGVIEAFAGETDDVDLAEGSLLVLGRLGRVEIGRRQGLPDVLTGYAPNNFTYVGAEFGPASGLSLDPGGRLISSFLGKATGGAIDELSLLGFGTGLFGDRSDKIIYVSPKSGGFLGGLSFSPDAADSHDGFGHLLQAGLTHENYWDTNALRVGASWSRVQLATGGQLDSFQSGAALTWHDDWLFGLSATVNPDRAAAPVPGWAEKGVGVAGSMNFNRGPWTAGGFLQWARSKPAGTDDESLRAASIGMSYRASTRVRSFLGYYLYHLDGNADERDGSGRVLTLGIRLTI